MEDKHFPHPPIVKILLFPLAFFILLGLYFKIFGPLPISLNSTVTNKVDLFTAQGEGKVTAVPDIAEVNFGATITASQVKDAQDQANTIINKITEDLKNLGIADKDLKTNSYYVYPTYDYSSARQRITGYQVRINLLATIRDFEKINNAIDIATNDGANQVSGLNFRVNDEKLKELQNEARKKAVDEAKQKAEGLAQAAGIRLGRIINVQEGTNGLVGSYLRNLAVPQGGGGDASVVKLTDIQPGEQEVTINVTLSYEVL